MRQQTDKCYRTVCQNPHDNCKHTQMGTLYCRSCAHLINRANPEVPGLVTLSHHEIPSDTGCDGVTNTTEDQGNA